MLQPENFRSRFEEKGVMAAAKRIRYLDSTNFGHSSGFMGIWSVSSCIPFSEIVTMEWWWATKIIGFHDS